MKLNTQFCKSLNLTNICLTSYIDILLLRKPLGDRGTLRAGGTADDSASCSEVPAAPAASGLGCTKCPEILKRSKDVSAADLKDFQGYPLVFLPNRCSQKKNNTFFNMQVHHHFYRYTWSPQEGGSFWSTLVRWKTRFSSNSNLCPLQLGVIPVKSPS